LNASNGATFFLGVSGARVNIGTSALLFFVPSGLVGSGYLVFYSSWRCSGQSASAAVFRCCPSGWHSWFHGNGTTKSLSRSLRSLGRAKSTRAP
jgi:hypothetical protein